MSVRPHLESAVRSTSNFLPRQTADQSPAQPKYAVLNVIKSFCHAALNFKDLNVRTVAAKVSLLAIAYLAYKYFSSSATNNNKSQPDSTLPSTGSNNKIRTARQNQSLSSSAKPASTNTVAPAQSSSQSDSRTTTIKTKLASYSSSSHSSGRGATAASAGSSSSAARTENAAERLLLLAVPTSRAGHGSTTPNHEYDSEQEEGKSSAAMDSTTGSQGQSPLMGRQFEGHAHVATPNFRRNSSASSTSGNENEVQDADPILLSSEEREGFSGNESPQEGHLRSGSAAGLPSMPNEESGEENSDLILDLPLIAENAAPLTLDLNELIRAGATSSPPSRHSGAVVTPGLSGFPAFAPQPPAPSQPTPGSTYAAHVGSEIRVQQSQPAPKLSSHSEFPLNEDPQDQRRLVHPPQFEPQKTGYAAASKRKVGATSAHAQQTAAAPASRASQRGSGKSASAASATAASSSSSRAAAASHSDLDESEVEQPSASKTAWERATSTFSRFWKGQ